MKDLDQNLFRDKSQDTVTKKPREGVGVPERKIKVICKAKQLRRQKKKNKKKVNAWLLC